MRYNSKVNDQDNNISLKNQQKKYKLNQSLTAKYYNNKNHFNSSLNSKQETYK